MMHKFRKVPLKTAVTVVCLTVFVCAGLALIFYLTHKSWSDSKGPTKAQKKEMAELRATLSGAQDELKLKGYIEQHSIYPKTHKDFYGIQRVLLAATSNYYDSKYSLSDFDASRQIVVAMGYKQELTINGYGLKYMGSETDYLNSGRVVRCFRKDTSAPGVELCLSFFKDPQTEDIIGGGSNTLNPFFNNTVRISKPFDLILSARRYDSKPVL